MQEDGTLVVFRVREGMPQLLTSINILCNPDNLVTNLCVCYAHSTLLWTEQRQKEGRYNSVLYSLDITAVQRGEIGKKQVVCNNCPQVSISASGSVAALVPK